MPLLPPLSPHYDTVLSPSPSSLWISIHTFFFTLGFRFLFLLSKIKIEKCRIILIYEVHLFVLLFSSRSAQKDGRRKK